MRHFLVSAALAAFAFVTPAAAQGNAAKIQQMCPDLTYNQIGMKLAGLVEQYEFDNDPEVAAEQAASLLCSPQAQTREAVVVLPPPPHHGQRHRPPPQFRLPPPPRRHAAPQQRYLPPPHGYTPRPHGPVAGGRYGNHHQGVPPHRPSFQRQVTKTCDAKEQAPPPPTHSREGIAYLSCDWVDQVPNRPCGGWHCKTY